MSGFRAPYRITTVFDRLKARTELADCEITIEELPADREAGYFPSLQFDTARVFVRYKGFSINVAGRLDDGNFRYCGSSYCDDAPWGDQYAVPMTDLDKLIELIVQRFQTVPKG